MADVDEIIHFIKSLKRGFDKDLFQNKIDELGYAVDIGLAYDDFHTLFKVWLNLSIPLSKWVSLGSCLVPPDSVEERTVEYAYRWLLGNMYVQANVQRVGFLLDWLTAAMESDSIHTAALDAGYEIFYTMLALDSLTNHAMKLVYNLTKPSDVERWRVLELIDHAKKREGKKSLYRQLQVLLGLFKSYKPECVPEDVPAVSIHTAFRKLNVPLLTRFKRNQQRRNMLNKEKGHLTWTNNINYESGINKKNDHLVPDLSYNMDIRKQHNMDREMPMEVFEFSDSASLLHHFVNAPIARPNRIRSLLCNNSGIVLLSIMTKKQHDFLSCDIYKIFNTCFLESHSSYTYKEKRDFLQKVSLVQRTMSQGVPVVTRFLAQYLPFWNERDYFAEILDLAEWLSPYCLEYVRSIIDSLCKVYHRAEPMEQCTILKTLTNIYTNMVYASKKSRQTFQTTLSPQRNYSLLLPEVAAKIADLCNKQLQINPDDTRVLYMSVWSAERRAVCELRHGVGIGAVPATLTLALPLLSPSAGLVENVATILILYKKILATHKNEETIRILSLYMTDVLNCLFSEEALSDRKNGLIFDKLHPQLVSKLTSFIPDIDSKFSIRNHSAFAPYTYVNLEGNSDKDADNTMWFKKVIESEFDNLSRFLKKALPQLRYHS